MCSPEHDGAGVVQAPGVTVFLPGLPRRGGVVGGRAQAARAAAQLHRGVAVFVPPTALQATLAAIVLVVYHWLHEQVRLTSR